VVPRPRRILLAASVTALAVLGVHCVSRALNGHSLFLSRTRATQNLERALTTLRALHVTGYRNLSWCKLLTVDGATYMETSNPSTCCWEPDDRGCRAYDRAAGAKHAQVAALLSATGVRVDSVTVEESPQHTLRTAEFGLSACAVCRDSYEYRAPGQGDPEGFRNELRYQHIRPGWWLRIEDWN
jgi:hypothetical protein